MAKKRNKSLEEIFKGTGVNVSSTQPTSVAQQNQAIQKQGSWGSTGSGTGGTRIIGTGGGTMQHTAAGAQKVAALSGSKYSKTGALVDTFSRGVNKTPKINNAATAFKPAPVMSKPKQTKQDRLATVSAELDDMRKQRNQLLLENAGFKSGVDTTKNANKISELTDSIQKAKKQKKELENDVYGYTGNFFSDTAKRAGRVFSGVTQSVGGTAAETAGQIIRNPIMYANIGSIVSDKLFPEASKIQQQAVENVAQDLFDFSDALNESSTENKPISAATSTWRSSSSIFTRSKQ